MQKQASPVSLRLHLREGTADSHAALDAMSGAGDIAQSQGYTRLLTNQYRARLPIERWIARRCPIDCSPPPMAPKLAEDLEALSVSLPASDDEFVLPDQADPIGLSWAIAGSHLGNRMMLKDLQKFTRDLPAAFLGDQTMGAFWQQLRPRLNATVDASSAAGAILAAQSVFSHFLAAFRADVSQEAAA